MLKEVKIFKFDPHFVINSNQDPKGGGIAGVDVEFFVGLRSL